MAVTDIPLETITNLNSIILGLQALGILSVLWIGMQITLFYLNIKRYKQFQQVREQINRIEKKLDRLQIKRK